MFDFSPEFNENNAPMYTWLHVRVWIDADTVQVHRRFPHLNLGTVFGEGSVSDYRDCMNANQLMIHCCVDIHLRLTRQNCDNYDTVIEKLNARTTEFSTAFKYYRDRTPNYNPHP